jgi:hypothetical protein
MTTTACLNCFGAKPIWLVRIAGSFTLAGRAFAFLDPAGEGTALGAKTEQRLHMQIIAMKKTPDAKIRIPPFYCQNPQKKVVIFFGFQRIIARRLEWFSLFCLILVVRLVKCAKNYGIGSQRDLFFVNKEDRHKVIIRVLLKTSEIEYLAKQRG